MRSFVFWFLFMLINIAAGMTQQLWLSWINLMLLIADYACDNYLSEAKWGCDDDILDEHYEALK